MEDNERIVYNSSIWDLHIHTCKSAKSSGEFQKMGIKDYLDCIEEIFEKYPDLNMISFTDHNAINYDVYEKYYKRKIAKRVKLIPGIEIDVSIENDKQYKHIIVYFDLNSDTLKEYSAKINDFIQTNTTKDNTSIEIGKLLDFLVGLRIQFILNPHCFKQGKRGIDFSWDEEKIKTEPHKYSDQFFCFWETSGKSDITRAEKLIKDYDMGERVSIVSFSDSSDKNKLEQYLSNPPQYFNCLPNFRGLQLAGVDCRRITNKKYSADNDAEAGNYIKKIKFGNNEIMLSPKLNVIIGGRGSGKSLLLDSLNLRVNYNNIVILNDKRTQYISKFKTKAYNGKLIEIKKKMLIDYFDQLYVSKIFEGNNNINVYFELEFNKIKEPKLNTKIIKDFSKTVKNTKHKNEKVNISNLIKNFIVINTKDKLLSFNDIDEDGQEYIKYISFADSYDKIIEEMQLADEIKYNEDIKDLYRKLCDRINKEIYKYNKNIIINKMALEFKKMYNDYRSEKSVKENDKNDVKRSFKYSFENEISDIVRKVRIINGYIKVTLNSNNSIDFSNSENTTIQFPNGNSIRFEKSVIRERPFEYFARVSKDYLNGFKGIDQKFIYKFCYKKLTFKSKKNEDEYLEELEKFDLNNVKTNNILFCKKGESYFENIENFSPGKKSNVLLEYILSKETKVPLLIDQPEDNIDNSTIYNELTNWIYAAKFKRQLLVVTHDANVAINADAENIIVAEEKNKDEYDYKYGALEYSDNIDKTANILDGGIEAVEKRLKKYGNE